MTVGNNNEQQIKSLIDSTVMRMTNTDSNIESDNSESDIIFGGANESLIYLNKLQLVFVLKSS